MDMVLVIANGLLVLVTAAYVLLTRSLAKSSEVAAESSAKAATAAQDAAAHAARAADAAVASVPVDFAATPSVEGPKGSAAYAATVAAALATGGDWLRVPVEGRLLVTVTCVGATVYLHGATLKAVDEADAQPPLGVLRTRITEVQAELTSWHGQELPTRLHQNEEFMFVANDVAVSQGQVASLALTVQYSLDGKNTMERQVTWQGVHGRDFLYASERKRS